jgi:hypothetical protein
MITLVWDCYYCPNCGREARMNLMSVIARCACGWVYIADYMNAGTGWYESIEAYRTGAAPVPSTRSAGPDPHPASLQTTIGEAVIEEVQKKR